MGPGFSIKVILIIGCDRSDISIKWKIGKIWMKKQHQIAKQWTINNITLNYSKNQ